MKLENYTLVMAKSKMSYALQMIDPLKEAA